jgi:hypothetical protein
MFRWLLSWFSVDALVSELNNRDVSDSELGRIDGALTREKLIHNAPQQFILDICEERGIGRYQEPIEELEQLPDEPGRVYVWHVDSEDKRQGWLQTLSQHERDYGALDALHIVITDKEEMFQMEQEELAGYV